MKSGFVKEKVSRHRGEKIRHRRAEIRHRRADIGHRSGGFVIAKALVIAWL